MVYDICEKWMKDVIVKEILVVILTVADKITGVDDEKVSVVLCMKDLGLRSKHQYRKVTGSWSVYASLCSRHLT